MGGEAGGRMGGRMGEGGGRMGGGWGKEGGGWGEDGGRRGEEGELRRWTRSGLHTDDFELESSRSQILCLNFLSLPLTWKNLAKDVMPTTERSGYLVPVNLTPEYPL